MAYRRSLSIRSTLLARRFNPSFSYLSHENDRSKQEESQPYGSKIETFLEQRRSFGSYVNTNSGLFSGAFHRTGSTVFGSGLCLHRYMSTSSNDGALFANSPVNTEAVYTDAPMGAEAVFTDAPVEAITSQLPAMSEVAIAAADSAYPVAALQYFIDGVHSFTGFNWWASIALTTLLIRGATVPFLINQLKATAKLTLMRPRMEEIKEQIENSGEPEAVAEGQKKMKALFKEYGVTPFTPLKGLLIQGPVFISFFLAISNMAEKVPSFKTGGAFWFTDLTVPDAMYAFPILTALTFLATVEFNMQEGLEGNPIAGTMKKFSRGLALVTVPFTMNFPQAIFCYWITSNVFSFCYGSVLRVPGVKKALGVPDIPVPPPSQKAQSSLSFLETIKQAAASRTNTAAAKPAISGPGEKSKSLDKKASTTAALSQRLRNLEKQVKQKKRLKRR